MTSQPGEHPVDPPPVGASVEWNGYDDAMRCRRSFPRGTPDTVTGSDVVTSAKTEFHASTAPPGEVVKSPGPPCGNVSGGQTGVPVYAPAGGDAEPKNSVVGVR